MRSTFTQLASLSGNSLLLLLMQGRKQEKWIEGVTVRSWLITKIQTTLNFRTSFGWRIFAVSLSTKRQRKSDESCESVTLRSEISWGVVKTPCALCDILPSQGTCVACEPLYEVFGHYLWQWTEFCCRSADDVWVAVCLSFCQDGHRQI